jgi:hypothetical protein
MGSIGAVASLYATLGLDDVVFNTKLAGAQAKLIAAADQMALPIDRITKFLEKMGASTHIDKVTDQFNELTAAGLTATEAMATLTAGLAKMEAEERSLAKTQLELKAALATADKAEIEQQLTARKASADLRVAQETKAEAMVSEMRGQYAATWSALLKEEEAVQKALAAEYVATWHGLLSARDEATRIDTARRVAQEKQALAIMGEMNREYTALWEELLVQRETAMVAINAEIIASEKMRVAAEVEADVRREAAMKVIEAEVIESEKLRQRLNAETNAAIIAQERAAAAERAAIQRGITQAAFASGGYGAGRVAGLGGLLGSVSTPVIAGAGLAMAGYELAKFTDQAMDAARATKNLSEELGISWAETRQLQEMARITGVEINTLQQGSWRLAAALDSTSSTGKMASKAIQDMGLDGQSSGSLMLSFIENLAKIPDDTERIFKAHQVLGRASYQIIPLIANYAQLQQLMEQLGTQTSPRAAEAMIEQARQLSALGVSWDRYKQKLADAMGIPILNWLVDSANNISAVTGAVQGLISMLGGISGQKEFPQWGPEYTDEQRKINEKAQQDADKADADRRRANHKLTLEELRDELSAAKTAEKELNSALNRGVSPLGQYTSPTRAMAEEDYAKAVADVKRIQAEIDAMTGKSEARTQAAQAHAYRATVQAVRDDEEAKKARLKLELLSEDAIAVIDEASANQQRDRLIKYNNDVLAVTIEANNKLLEAEKGRAQDEKDLSLLRASDKAKAQTEEANQVLRNGAAAQIAQIAAAERQKEFNLRKQQAEEDRRLEDQKTNDRVRALQLRLQKEEEHAVKGIELDKRRYAFDEEQGRITIERRIALDVDAENREAAIQRDAISAEIVALDDRKNRIGQTDEAVQAKKAELIRQLQALEDGHHTRLLAYIEEQLRGTDAVTQAIIKQQDEQRKLNLYGSQQDNLIKLTNEEIKTKLLTITTQGLGKVYADLATGVAHAWGQVGKTLAGGILNPENFTKDWKAALHSIEQELLGTFIQGLLNIGAAWALQALKIGVVSKGVAATQIFDAAAVAEANAIAATALIPIIGPTIALSVGESMYWATLAASLPKVTFAEGGKVPHDMLAMVHGGESYYTETQTRRIESALGNRQGGGGDTFDFRGASFGAGLSQPVVESMMESAVSKIRRRGGLATRSGRF